MTRRTLWHFSLTFAVAVLSAGCSDQAAKQEVTMRKACLAKLGIAYHGFHAARGRAPAGIDELVSYLKESSQENDEVSSESAKRLSEGAIVMYWNAALHDDGDENEKYVLGFEAAVPRNGGYLITGGGTVVLVTGTSFKDFKEFPQPSG